MRVTGRQVPTLQVGGSQVTVRVLTGLGGRARYGRPLTTNNTVCIHPPPAPTASPSLLARRTQCSKYTSNYRRIHARGIANPSRTCFPRLMVTDNKELQQKTWLDWSRFLSPITFVIMHILLYYYKSHILAHLTVAVPVARWWETFNYGRFRKRRGFPIAVHLR